MKYRPLPAGMREGCAVSGRLVEMRYTTETYDEAHALLTKRALVYLPTVTTPTPSAAIRCCT